MGVQEANLEKAKQEIRRQLRWVMLQVRGGLWMKNIQAVVVV